MTEDDTSTDRPEARESTMDRRALLKATGTTIVGGTGLAAASSSASAQFGGPEVIQVDDGWFGWSADDSLPVTDELLIFIHGWFGDTTVESQASDVLGSLEAGGYSPDQTVAIEWPGSTLNFFGAEADTEDVGEVVAGLIEEFYDNGGGNIRLVGHSLGGRCVYWTATKLSSGYEIETVAGLGAAADGSEICGNPWNPGLSNACEVRNYYSLNDSTVGGAYGGLGDTALGTEGAGCNPASNYTDVDVTYSVGSHLAYLGDSAVGSDLAAAINAGCGGSGSGGGTPTQISEGTYRLTNANSGKFLEVANADTSDGANVRQYADTGHPCQEWDVSANGDGTYTFTNANSGKFLEVAGAGTSDGDNVRQYADTGSPCQDWIVLDNGDGTVSLENANSGKVAEVYEASTADGANVVQWSSNGGAWQRWNLQQI